MSSREVRLGKEEGERKECQRPPQVDAIVKTSKSYSTYLNDTLESERVSNRRTLVDTNNQSLSPKQMVSWTGNLPWRRRKFA